MEVAMEKLVNSMKCLMVVVTLIFISTGCHNDAKDNQYAGFSKAGMKYKNIVVSNFSVSPRGVAEDDPRNVREHMLSAQAGCVSELLNSNLFDNVAFNSSSSTDSTLIVQGELTELRIVSGAARAWGGAFVGKSVMAFHVKLVDGKSGNIVAERDIRDDMGNAYVPDSQLPRIVGQLIAELVINSSKM
jgi:hypothetical protein